MAMKKALSEKMADLKEVEVLEIVKDEMEAGTDPMELLNACQKGVAIVGDRYENGIYFISELMMAREIFKQVNAILSSKLDKQTMADKGSVVMGTVHGDIDDQKAAQDNLAWIMANGRQKLEEFRKHGYVLISTIAPGVPLEIFSGAQEFGKV